MGRRVLRQFMNRIHKRNVKVLGTGIVLLAVILGIQEVRAEIYSVQLGVYQQYPNAQREFSRLNKSLPSNLTDYLRVEKTGKNYILKVGKFEDPEQALVSLSALKDYAPGAFIRKENWILEKILLIQKKPDGPLEHQPPEEKVRSSKKVKNIPAEKEDSPLQVSKILFSGTIREINPFAPEQLGLPPGKDIYRLIVRVEETREIEGFPDFLKEQKGQLLTIFSETNPPFFQPGKRITAIVKYRGNRFSRYYWITKPRAIKP
jgi:hypothetical protein